MYQNTEINRDNSRIVFFIFNLLSTSVLSLSKIQEGTPLYIPPLTYIVNKKIIKNPNEFSG